MLKIKDFVNALLQQAIAQRASDIFILPLKQETQIKVRTWRGLTTGDTVAAATGQEIINYLKYSAQMDIAEHRRPQVGALTYKFKEQDYFLRFSSLGNFDDRESLVIRIIYQIEQSHYLLRQQLSKLVKLAEKRGLIVTSGPTGSGKTTTMYELARQIGKNKMVMTIEDPVEVYEQSFLQTQVNNEAGIDYYHLLKAALRHRPDILIIGEIRDEGTARLAVDAALSGHLVLATLHAKSTLQTVSRLQGLKVSRQELANCLTAVSYQRLLPVDQGQACLLDIAEGNFLTANVRQKGSFVNWHENLCNLERKGKIAPNIKQKFWEG